MGSARQRYTLFHIYVAVMTFFIHSYSFNTRSRLRAISFVSCLLPDPFRPPRERQCAGRAAMRTVTFVRVQQLNTFGSVGVEVRSLVAWLNFGCWRRTSIQPHYSRRGCWDAVAQVSNLSWSRTQTAARGLGIPSTRRAGSLHEPDADSGCDRSACSRTS